MAALVSCPDPRELRAFVEGRSTPDDVERLASHLEKCTLCSDSLEQLLAADSMLHLSPGHSWPTEAKTNSVVNALIEKLCSAATSAAVDASDTPSAAAEREAAPLEFSEILAPAQAPDELGRLANYRALKVLGQGGMGIVFLAEDTQLQRMVALKIMKPALAAKPSARQRFLREARATAAVRHDNIVTIFQVGEDHNMPFLAMELLEGISLDSRLRAVPAPSVPEALRVGRQTADGLAAAHDRGLIHRDIKPGNLWLEPSGRIKILDFGLARALVATEQVEESALTQSGVVVGTPTYMAPEQARGDPVDHRCDLFSLGCTLYRMTTGTLPYRGKDHFAVLTSLAVDTPAPPHELSTEVPPPLSALIMQLLAKDPAARPASARVVAERLLAIERDHAGGPESRAADACTPDWKSGPPTSADEDMALAAMATAERCKAPSKSTLAPPRTARHRLLLTVAALLLVLLPFGYFFGGTVIRFATNKGVLVIEVNDSKVEITVKQNGVEVFDKSTERRFELTAGTGEIEVYEPASGLKLATKRFTLTRGGRETLNVIQELAKAKAELDPELDLKSKDQDRRAAQWVISLGGKVILDVDGQSRETDAARNIPEQPFEVSAIDLNRNEKLTNADLKRLQGLKRLGRLEIGHTKVGDAGLANLKGLSALTHLGLDGAPVTDAGLVHLAGLPGLTDVGLNGTTIGDAGLANLKKLTGLRGLGLIGTQVSDAGLAHLVEMRNLKGLQLAGTKISDAALAQLRKALPNCMITRESADPERRAAEWALSVGASVVWVRIGDKAQACHAIKDLPVQPFHVLEIRLVGNEQITDAGLENFRGLSHLQHLRLPNSPVTDAGLTHLKGLINLKELWLADTRISDLGLASIKDLTQLTKLNLQDTKVGDAGIAQLTGLTRLTDLNLYRTQVTDAGLKHLKNLTELRVLDLNGTQLSGIGLVHLKGMINLTSLDLDATKVDDSGLAHLKGLSKLSRLSLLATAVTDAGLEHLSGLGNLDGLGLSSTGISDAGLAHLSKLTNLTSLGFDVTQVSDAGLSHLRDMKKLNGLSMLGTRVTDASLELLISLPSLDYLGLYHTRLSAKGHATLKAAFPKATIHWSEPNRTAAEAILALRGSVQLRVKGTNEDRTIKAAADLPDEYFQVTRAILPNLAKLPPDVLEKLRYLRVPEFDRLESLDFSGSVVAKTDLDGLKGFPFLSVLSLSRTAVSNDDLAPLKDFPGLTDLSLANTKVGDDGLAHLKAVKSLRRLDLDGCLIRGAGLTHLKELAKLTELNLGCPTFTDVFARKLADLKLLQRLSLAGSGITDKGLTALDTLADLRQLNLVGCKVTAEGVARLQKALPNCKITYLEKQP